jgi:hypothetical protein
MLTAADAGRFRLERTVRLAEGLERLVVGGIDVVLRDLSLPEGQVNDVLSMGWVRTWWSRS